jgi:ABC-type sugar transport system ATPase subunit
VQVSHQLAVIIGGKLRQIGTPEELQSSPASDEVAAFLHAQAWD